MPVTVSDATEMLKKKKIDIYLKIQYFSSRSLGGSVP